MKIDETKQDRVGKTKRCNKTGEKAKVVVEKVKEDALTKTRMHPQRLGENALPCMQCHPTIPLFIPF